MSSASNLSVLDLNAQAISCLLLGDKRGCSFQLESALNAYRRAAAMQATGVETQARPPSASLRIHMVPLPLSPARKTASQFGPNIFGVLHRAFMVEDDRGSYEPDHDTIVPAVILYNLGLVFHREAIENGQSLTLAKANEFYRYAMALVERGQFQSRSLLAAIANNMAHISACFFNEESLHTAMEVLMNVMNDPETRAEFDQDDLDLLGMNWIFYSEHHHVGLAAAA
jgi:hypothetical protein